MPTNCLWSPPGFSLTSQPWEMDNKSGQTLKGLAAHMPNPFRVQ
jgi:hypothetical protein